MPLTKFSGTFSCVLRSRGSLTKRITLTIEFLANVRTNRIEVDSAPSWELPRLICGIQTTGGTYEASGEYRNQQGDLVEAWSGSGSLSFGTAAFVTGFIDRTGFVQSSIGVSAHAPYMNNATPSIFNIDHGVGTLLTQMSDAFEIPGATYTGGSGPESATGTFSKFTSTFAPTSSTVR